MEKLVPDDFEVPERLEHERFRLRMLSVDDVVKDFEAINSVVDHEGRPEPAFVPTVKENLVDLGWHQKEFQLRRSFAYTVVALDESRVLGCVYLYPSNTHDVRVEMWVRREAWEDGLDPVLEATVRSWLEREWPFASADYGARGN
ncbi:MAG: GNAT family N-acetyltransferase [Actinomycetota bacterium]|nr:GNAT family N-acetyltransferase [Actinomycetota bacterium]